MKIDPAMRILVVCLCLFGSRTVAAESLQEFLTEFRQYPLGISQKEFLQRFPDAKQEGVVFVHKISCPPFDQVVFQFRNDKLIAVMLAPTYGEPPELADWIMQWADHVFQTAEATWGKAKNTVAITLSNNTAIAQSADSHQLARYHWQNEQSRVWLQFTTPASLRALSHLVTNRNITFIMSLGPPVVAPKELPAVSEKPRAAVSAQPPRFADLPAIRFADLPEIPSEYRGSFYLHKQIVKGKIETVAPSKVFGTIDAKQVTLDDGGKLKVKQVRQAINFPGPTGNLETKLVVTFEDRDYVWLMSRRGLEISIGQGSSKLKFDPRDTDGTRLIMQVTLFVVSREK
jgi:hypothetical protein